MHARNAKYTIYMYIHSGACFTLISTIHDYNTQSKSKGNLYIQFNRTSMAKNNVIHRGIQYWNCLDDFMKILLSLPVFVKKLKTQFLEKFTEFL